MRGLSRLTTLIIVIEGLALGSPEIAEASSDRSVKSWKVIGSTNPGTGSELRAVTAVSPKDVWAVGWFADPITDSSRPLVQHWDGERWTIVAAAAPEALGLLQSVDAASSDDVWAVGSTLTELQSSRALALHRDGRAWDTVRVPKPERGRFVSTVLTDVVAIDADDAWAVGYWSSIPDASPSPLIEHWNGRRWRPVPNPDLGTWSELHGMAATGPDDVWAVGNTEVLVGNAFYSRALVEHWDGKAWKVVRMPVVARRQPYGLEGVDTRSSSDAWAVGAITRGADVVTLAFHWDGDRWSRVPTIDPSAEFQLLGGVAIAARHRVWAVGSSWDADRQSDVTLVLRWNGRGWVQERSPNPEAGNTLVDVAALPSRQFAVGSYWANDGEGPQRTLAVQRAAA
jgi:hypothetical protein